MSSTPRSADDVRSRAAGDKILIGINDDYTLSLVAMGYQLAKADAIDSGFSDIMNRLERLSTDVTGAISDCKTTVLNTSKDVNSNIGAAKDALVQSVGDVKATCDTIKNSCQTISSDLLNVSLESGKRDGVISGKLDDMKTHLDDQDEGLATLGSLLQTAHATQANKLAACLDAVQAAQAAIDAKVSSTTGSLHDELAAGVKNITDNTIAKVSALAVDIKTDAAANKNAVVESTTQLVTVVNRIEATFTSQIQSSLSAWMSDLKNVKALIETSVNDWAAKAYEVANSKMEYLELVAQTSETIDKLKTLANQTASFEISLERYNAYLAMVSQSSAYFTGLAEAISKISTKLDTIGEKEQFYNRVTLLCSGVEALCKIAATAKTLIPPPKEEKW